MSSPPTQPKADVISEACPSIAEACITGVATNAGDFTCLRLDMALGHFQDALESDVDTVCSSKFLKITCCLGSKFSDVLPSRLRIGC